MSRPFRPLLSATWDESIPLSFPVLVSPKLDGIRCLSMEGGAFSRSMKLIPNRHVQRVFENLPEGLDGELIVGNPTDPDVYRKTNSAVMSQDGEPDFRYYVFDWHNAPDCPFEVRYGQFFVDTPPSPIVIVPHHCVHTLDELLTYEEEHVALGYEGIMIRDPKGRYKQGRSTKKEGILFKVKRFQDAEARVVGFTELMHNENEAKLDERGFSKRSSHKENKVPGNTLGNLICETPEGVQFEIGTGFTAAQRQEIWDKRESYLNRWVTYKFQPVGIKDKPRLPVFKDFRAAVDMDAPQRFNLAKDVM